MGRRLSVRRSLGDYPPPTPQSTPCRLWQGPLTKKGYGLRPDHKLIHRWVWEQVNGPIPDGLFVCHHCDQPLCYRLDHLFLGDGSDNMLDAHRKGRLVKPDAQRHHDQVCAWCDRTFRRRSRQTFCSISCGQRHRYAADR